VRLLASGDAGAVAFGNTGERGNNNAGQVQCQTPRVCDDDQMASFLHLWNEQITLTPHLTVQMNSAPATTSSYETSNVSAPFRG
jgi:hypothetical protein